MGLLGGRYDATSQLPDGDIRTDQLEWLRWFANGRPDPGYLAAIDTVRTALTHDGRSLAQDALGWIWAHHPRTIPLPGFRNTTQVGDNTGALTQGSLPAEQYAAAQAAKTSPSPPKNAS